MQVQTFIQKLSYGELSNLAIGNDGLGTIDSPGKDRIVSYTNTVLTGLYSRFTHKRGYVNLTLVDGTNEYVISDLANAENMIKILSIRQLDDPNTVEIDEEAELTIQVHPRLGGIKLMDYNRIYIPEPATGVELLIEFQDNHPLLTIPAVDAEEIHLAPILHEALEVHVASKIWGAMSGEAHQVKAGTLLRRFNHLMFLVESEDLLQETETTSNDKLRDKGFI